MAQFVNTDRTQQASLYTSQIDANMKVLGGIAAQFQCFPNAPNDMTIKIAAGRLVDSARNVIDKSIQTSSTITAPVSDPRIDLVTIDAAGDLAITTGVEDVSPAIPAIPAGHLPIAYITLATSTTAITDSLITDYRTALPPIVSTISGTANRVAIFDGSGSLVESPDITTTELGLLNGVTGTLVTESATQTLTNKTLTNPTVTNYSETRYTANSSTAITLDLANGTVQDITLTGNAFITFPSNAAGKSFLLILRQDGSGGKTVTWDGDVRWPSSTEPTLTSTANKVDIFSFVCDGTYWYGATGGQNYL